MTRARHVVWAAWGERLRALLAGAAALLLSAQAPASSSSPPGAAPAGVHLEYSGVAGAESCISGERLAREVEARLGRQVFVPAARAEVTARVVVRSGEGGGFRASVELFDERGRGLGSRELESSGAGCAALNEPLALVLSLAADMPAELRQALAREHAGASPSGAAEADISAEKARPGELPAAPAPLPEPPARAPARARRAPALVVTPAAGVVVLFGPLPSPALGLSLGVALEVGDLGSVSVSAAGFLAERQSAPPEARGADFAAGSMALEACPWSRRLGGFEARACAAQWVGRVSADGFGFDEARRTTRWLVATGASVSLSRRVGPLSVALSPQLLGVLFRRRYFFTDAGVDITLHDDPPLYGAVTLRVGAEL